jgi:hypothetical protein
VSPIACAVPATRAAGAEDGRWPLERVLFALAGSMMLFSPRSVLYPRQQASP